MPELLENMITNSDKYSENRDLNVSSKSFTSDNRLFHVFNLISITYSLKFDFYYFFCKSRHQYSNSKLLPTVVAEIIFQYFITSYSFLITNIT